MKFLSLYRSDEFDVVITLDPDEDQGGEDLEREVLEAIDNLTPGATK